MKFKASLRNQLVLLFTGMLTAILAVVIIVTMILNSHYISKNAEESLHRIVEDAKSTLSLYFEERKLQLQGHALSLFLR